MQHSPVIVVVIMLLNDYIIVLYGAQTYLASLHIDESSFSSRYIQYRGYARGIRLDKICIFILAL